MKDIASLYSWINQTDLKRPIVIAGPCSAETSEQVMDSAIQLKSHGIQIFRAGIWKPRTRPNSFEGVGEEGLGWLQEVKQKTGMMTTTEVANAKHAELALASGVDILWLGARTTVNPFAVQEIADALKGKDVPVMVKNPMNPDLDLWIGALERLYNVGITKLVAVHRGFSAYHKTKYRNEPQWQIPIELRRRIPNLPIFCDPSHICGTRKYLSEVSQISMDLNYNGLIIESHPNPQEAWSDAEQQLTPKDLSEMLNSLVIRKAKVSNKNLMDTLSELRTMIDLCDNQLLDLIEKRMAFVEQIGQHKKKHNIAVLQNKRWSQILQRIIRKGKAKGLSKEFISTVFKAIHIESINHQTKIMNVETGHALSLLPKKRTLTKGK